MISDKEEIFMTSNCTNHTTATANSPTVPFTEECMGKLLTAYRALRNLEKLLSLIAGIDPTNGLLSKLRHMDNLLQDLSPLYDRNLDYDKQIYTKILENDSLSIPAKAHILLGSKDENGIPDTWAELPFNELIMKCTDLPEDTVQRTSVFTVENMVDLLTAYFGYFSLTEATGLFFGEFPCHPIIDELGQLGSLLCNLSPLYDLECDDDAIENETFTTVLESNDIGLWGKARLLMGSEL